MVKYADDITIVLPLLSDDTSCIRNEIIRETENLKQWCDRNFLKLNFGKSNALIISRYPVHFDEPLPINHVKSLKLLGITLNVGLNWNSHVIDLKVRACRRIHIIRRLKSMLPASDVHTVYTAIIRSLFEYASPVFIGLNKNDSRTLQRIENRVHRIIYWNAENQIRKCNCCDLEERRFKAMVKLFAQIEGYPSHILRNLLPRKLVYSQVYEMILTRTVKFSRTFLPIAIRVKNSCCS